MTPPYFVQKPRKSAGIAILLTFFFGPLGLFYASVTGGMIMTFLPVFLFLLGIVGMLRDSVVLLGLSVGLLVVFWLVCWLVSIIWAVISVSTYNGEIEQEERMQYALWSSHDATPSQFVVHINQKPYDGTTSGQETIQVTSTPNMRDWLKSNPGKSINDYYTKFGR